MSDRHLRNALKGFDFAEAFVEVGWNHLDQRVPGVEVDGHVYTLEPVAEKKGAQVFSVSPDAEGLIPPRVVRRKIDRKVEGSAKEHLLIFANRAKTKQVWLWVDRAPGKAPSYREHEWHESQDPEGLVQKLNQLAFAIEEEDTLTVVDVAAKMEQAFDKEQVTKTFYREFDRHRKTFLGEISGIPDEPLKEWYASALLNRLMFVYFLQRKGFLDGDRDYLSNRLARCRERFGDDEFYSFYRTFLLKLFHDGLGAPESRREAELRDLIGKVPYLNGGLFQIHDIERDFPDIQVPDEAFVALFDFFDSWDWTLDYRPLRQGNEINPDVLGYLFEQYINQKQMGAYYTKEDITGYITRNALLPFVLDEARRRHPAGFEGEGAIWRLLQQDPDAYIYPSVQHTARDEDGRPLLLPDEIAAGLEDVAKRDAWNTMTPSDWGLPTEIWRETVARRQRYEDLRVKLAAGKVNQTADLVSLNLDIEQFTQDAIETCEDPDLLRAFWKALRAVTVLDPTCGSGAFLFAALERLEALYTACLHRMQEFVGRLDADPDAHPQALSDFRTELKEAYDKGKHPNLTYFVLKRILLDNLYGVDIMPEAVEICKLRLFLKLAAQVEPGGRLEPLPDIDFNIRAGNALVGYASREEVLRGLKGQRVAGGADQGKLLFDEDQEELRRFEHRLEDVNRLMERFREQQQTYGGEVTPEDKEELRSRLQTLAKQLDRALARQYGVEPDAPLMFSRWCESHQPFHWFAEFYGVMSDGGFDTIIGNPPYVRHTARALSYEVNGYESRESRDLYAYTVERSLGILSEQGWLGLIVPVSIAASASFSSTRQVLYRDDRPLHLSHFANRPGQLFDGAQNRLTIVVAGPSGGQRRVMTSRYHRWDSRNGERDALLNTVSYTSADEIDFDLHGLIPKIGTPVAAQALNRLRASSTVKAHSIAASSFQVYWIRVPGYFCQFFLSPPQARPVDGGPSRNRGEMKELSFPDEVTQRVMHALLNSNIYYYVFCSFTDGRHINPSDVYDFPVDLSNFSKTIKEELADLSRRLESCMEEYTSQLLKSGLLVDSVDSKACKPIINQIDAVLAKHYGFTDEELDFIVNYDIKYRLGADAFEEEEAEA